MKKIIILVTAPLLLFGLGLAVFTVFFDQAVIVRRGTIYRVATNDKVVAFTFDDGPSPVWTPKILDALKESDALATFFMLGKYVEKYPEIARRIVEEGHDIGNHTYTHHGLLSYKMEELEHEINAANKVITDVTGKTTRYFRPPKAWLTDKEKRKVGQMGYKVILWTLNSKDWVSFDDKYMIKYILSNIRPGDIILFHDGGGVFTTEGGNRRKTVKTIPVLAGKLKEKGYRIVTITELLKLEGDGGER